MDISLDMLKKLRKATGVGVSDCRAALEDAKGDYVKAEKFLTVRGIEKAGKIAGKETSAGLVESYVHATGKVGVLVELRCETDFVARTDDFRHLAHELALQVAAMNPKNVSQLLKSPSIRDASLSVESLVKQVIAKVGENITVASFARIQIAS